MDTHIDCEVAYPASCSVCCRQLNNPKTLNCGHSFCLSPCLQQRVQVQQVICTICRKETPLPKTGRLEDFPTNTSLESVIESGDSSVIAPECQIPPTEKNSEKCEELCSMHDKVLEYFCQTCHSKLCPECAIATHDSNHVTLTIAQTSEKVMADLCEIEKEIRQVKEELQQKFTVISEAIATCDSEASEIKTAISEATSSAIKLVKENAKQLHVEVDAAAMIARERIRKVDTNSKEVSLYLDYVMGMMESLLNDFKINDFRRMEVINGLVEKKTKLQSEADRLRKEPVCDNLGVSFIPCQAMEIDIGRLNENCESKLPKSDISEKDKGLTAVKLRDDVKFTVSDDDYLGFAWFSLDVFACVSKIQYSTSKLQCTLESYRKVESMPNIEVNSAPKRFYTFPPVLGKNQRNILINGPKEVYQVTFDLSCNTTTVQERIVNDSISYDIAAISWDESREGFYALLNDGLTILKSDFSTSETPGQTWNVKLHKHIKCRGSRQFHVSQLGSMAIADWETVYFYKTIQPQFTKTVTRRENSYFIHPISVTSLNGGKSWVVGWKSSSKATNTLVISQYSQDFKFMHDIFTYCSGRVKIESVAFFDDIHFVVETKDDHIHQTQSTQNPVSRGFSFVSSNQSAVTAKKTEHKSSTLLLSLFYIKEKD